MISSQRKRTILIVQDLVKNKKLVIYRCHDCEIIILGAVSHLLISHCRGSNIFVGAVSNTLRLYHCDDLRIRGTMRNYIIGSSQNISSFILINSPPQIHEDDPGLFGGSLNNPTNISNIINKLHNPSNITFSPCNAWYNCMAEHMRSAGIDAEINYWDKPQFLWSGIFENISSSFINQGSQNPPYSLIPPKEFNLWELPVKYNDAANCSIPFKLPRLYQQKIDHSRSVIAKIHAHEKRETIEENFHEWLKETGNIIALTEILNLQKDLANVV